MKRSLLFIPAALAMALTLSSCQSAAETAPENESAASAASSGECLVSGAASESIKLDGDFESELSLNAEVPLVVEAAESTTLISGDGGELNSEEIYSVGVALFNGRTGELLSQQREALPASGSYQDAINSSISCANVGDQSVIVMPASEFFGEGQIEAGAVPGFEAGDSLVVAMDYGEMVEMAEVLEQAEGTDVPLPKEAPEVEVAENGEPTITFPKDLKAPKELTIYPMVEGDGPVVTEDQTVKVHYRGVIWRTGDEFDSSWVRGTPADFPVTGVIDGFKDALLGKTVGSRMLSIVPPAAGYGPEWLVANGYEEDDVMVFVLDILSAS